RLWYVSVITVLEDMAGVRLLDGYLARALEMYPRDPEVQLLAGIHQELLGAPRTSVYNARARRHANEEAEKHYRAVLAAAPDRQEARLRLGRLRLQQRDLAEARALLTPLVSA